MHQPTTDQPSPDTPATLSDDELEEVAAGAAYQIDYGASLARSRPAASLNTLGSITGGFADDGSLT